MTEESPSELVLPKGLFMWRVLCAGAIGVTVFAARPVFSQGPPSKESLRKLQAELDVLKQMIKDVEARLEKAKSEAEKKPGKGKGPGDGFGPPGFGKGKGYGKGHWPRGGEFGKGPPKYGKGPWAKPGEFGKGPPGKGPWAKGEFGKGPGGDWKKPGPPGRQADSNAEILRTLNEILREIQELRRQMKK